MNAENRVSVIGRATEHALKLRAPHRAFQCGSKRCGFFQSLLVILLGGEFEELFGVLRLRLELANHVQLLGRRRPLAQQRLRLVLVVPEIRIAGELIELLYFAFELRDVKDAPLAHQRAS